jgi:hypothetical protein
MSIMSARALAAVVHRRSPRRLIVLVTGNLAQEKDAAVPHALFTGMRSKPVTTGELHGMRQRCPARRYRLRGLPLSVPA